MVTAVTGMTNAAGASIAGADIAQPREPVLSEMAQATLDRLGQMHTDFASSASAIESRAGGVSAQSGTSGTSGTDSADLARSLDSVSEAFRTAAQMQSQIVQFSMATSISQSLGNNLNSFLKGT